jgi:mRNA interferase MazF
MKLKRGDLVTAAFQGGLGKPRPVVIVHAEEYIENHLTLLVCPFTSFLADSPNYRPTVIPSNENGLQFLSQIMADKITHIKKSAMGGIIGVLSDTDISRLEAALINIIGLRQTIVPQSN